MKIRTQAAMERAAKEAARDRLIEAARLRPQETLAALRRHEPQIRRLNPADLVQIVSSLVAALGKGCLDALSGVLGSDPSVSREIARLRFASER